MKWCVSACVVVAILAHKVTSSPYGGHDRYSYHESGGFPFYDSSEDESDDSSQESNPGENTKHRPLNNVFNPINLGGQFRPEQQTSQNEFRQNQPSGFGNIDRRQISWQRPIPNEALNPTPRPLRQNLNGQRQPQGSIPDGSAPPAASGRQQVTNVQQCMRDCPVTSEFNPVCGNNNVTYNNPGRLQCAKDCGVDVSLLRRTSCRVSAPAPAPSVIPVQQNPDAIPLVVNSNTTPDVTLTSDAIDTTDDNTRIVTPATTATPFTSNTFIIPDGIFDLPSVTNTLPDLSPTTDQSILSLT